MIIFIFIQKPTHLAADIIWGIKIFLRWFWKFRCPQLVLFVLTSACILSFPSWFCILSTFWRELIKSSSFQLISQFPFPNFLVISFYKIWMHYYEIFSYRFGKSCKCFCQRSLQKVVRKSLQKDFKLGLNMICQRYFINLK